MYEYFLPILLLCTILFWILKPKKQAKTKEQKRAELIILYEQKLQNELFTIKDKTLYQEKKIALLKAIAKELEFSIFFDKDDVRELVRYLSQKDFN